MSLEALDGKIFLVITGASRGIGRQIAITFGSLLQKGSHILLLARNLNGLQEVAKNLPSPKVTVHTVSMDLGNATKTDFEKTVLECLKGISRDEFDRVVLVHNVGTIGNITKFVNEMSDVDEWKQYYALNFFVPAVLNSVIMNLFDDSTNTKKVVINITSKFGVEANAACGYYCSVKAAREMFFKVFALENPDVNVLSYSPGPVETDMFHEVVGTIANPETKKQLEDMHKTKTVLTTEQTINRLVEVLKKHEYNAGDHVDYYDYLKEWQ